MQFKRNIANRVRELAKHFACIVLTGARQTGKTTLLKTIFPDHNYVTLDLPSLAEQAEKDPDTFLSKNKLATIIDEAQYAPGLFRHIKRTVDINPELKSQYILTGSQKFNLMKEVSDSLAGRAVWLELEGLSLEEIAAETGNKIGLDLITTFIYKGDMPVLWKDPKMPVEDYYRSYLATYLERDVRQILNISSLRDFERFIRLCAVRNGSLLNKSEIAKDVGVTVNTVSQWLSILEASNQITLLEPYFSNTGKRVVKTPKIYFNNVGMLSYLLGIKQDSLYDSPFIGALWETVVFSELRKKLKNTYPEGNLWFYRDNRQREVDFILEKDNRLNLIEVKWSENPDPRDLKTLEIIYKEMQQNKGNFMYQMGDVVTICRTGNEYLNDRGIRISDLSYISCL